MRQDAFVYVVMVFPEGGRGCVAAKAAYFDESVAERHVALARILPAPHAYEGRIVRVKIATQTVDLDLELE